MLYFLALLLGLLAAGFACWPWLKRRPQQQAVQHDQVVRDVFRNRVDELQTETVDASLRAEIENELGAVLLTETRGAETAAESRRNPRALALALAMLVPVAGVGLYYGVADPGLQDIRGAEEVLTMSADDVALQSWQRRLLARTQDVPDDSKSWYLLGHVHLKLGAFADSAEAFATTHQLAGDDLNIQVYWLQARYLAARGVLDDVSRNLAEKILEQQPNLPVVLEILAMDAFQRGDAEASIALLNRALSGATDIRQQASFASAIRQVREGMAEPPPGVTVDVSANGTTPPHASIFVVARPVGGGMPYAVVKRPAFLMPFSVRLDDLVNMSPARKLSDAEQFEVLVRLSATGNAMPQAGDWQWQSQPLKPAVMGASALDAILTPPE